MGIERGPFSVIYALSISECIVTGRPFNAGNDSNVDHRKKFHRIGHGPFNL
jgi:hypothetical protein